MRLTPGNRIPILVEDLTKLNEQVNELKEKTQTKAVKQAISLIRSRASGIKTKLETIGKKENLVRVVFIRDGKSWELFYTNISIPDAQKVFELYKEKLPHKGTDITEVNFQELIPEEVYKISRR